MADVSGRTLLYYLRRMRSRIAIACARRAARGVARDGFARNAWSDDRCRRIGTLAVVLDALSSVTRRAGKFRKLVTRMPETMLLAMIADPWTRKRPSRSALGGRHRADGSIDNGQLGYLRALCEAGFMYRQRLPEGDAKLLPGELGRVHHIAQPDGSVVERRFAMTRYWLVDDAIEKLTGEEREAMMAVHREGCDVAEGLEPSPLQARDERIAQLASMCGPPQTPT
jgi:hypothetical protein